MGIPKCFDSVFGQSLKRVLISLCVILIVIDGLEIVLTGQILAFVINILFFIVVLVLLFKMADKSMYHLICCIIWWIDTALLLFGMIVLLILKKKDKDNKHDSKKVPLLFVLIIEIIRTLLMILGCPVYWSYYKDIA